MLTRDPPVIARMGGRGELRAYVPYGDILGYRFLCRFVAGMFYSDAEKMKSLESVPIEATIDGKPRV